MEPNRPAIASALDEHRQDLCAAVMFFTRLPAERWCPNSIRPTHRVFRLAPLAGVLVAVLAAGVLALGSALRLPPSCTAVLAIGMLLFATGALHEDGLADVADGFGGGQNRERKLAIMRDSRIGTYGTLALAGSLVLRTASLTVLLDHGVGQAVAALIIAAAFSRALMLVPMAMLGSARPDGLAHAAGRLAGATPIQAFGLAVLFSAPAVLLASPSISRVVLALGLAATACGALTRLAHKQIGGVTGDVVGATQQVTELAILVTLSAG